MNKENIGEGSDTVTILENDLPPITRDSKDHTQTFTGNDLTLTAKRLKFSDESVENVITLSKLIGLLLMFCPPTSLFWS